MFMFKRRSLLVMAACLGLCLAVAGPAVAHEGRHVAGYDMVVGMMNEPVYTGDKSGLEFSVFKDDQPVEGLEATLTAEVIFQGGAPRSLPISARWGEPGWYQSVFYPTAAGPYTFRIHGTIEGTAVDETFSAGPDTFGEVQAVTSGQFPTALPPVADIAADASKGAQAASQVTLALGAGVIGILLGLVGIGLAFASRRRAA
jgi:hypothetical protein